MADERTPYIFVSYERTRADTAREIAAALQVDGYEVFFDRESLKPGKPYGRYIEEAIARCDVFIVLVSAEIFKEESYVLSELRFARQTPDRPIDRILPVVLRPVDYRKLDPWLRSLTALYPEGNTAAEVAKSVREIVADRAAIPLLAAAVRPDVAPAQLQAYRVLWGLTGLLPRWGRDAAPSYGDLEQFSQKLRKWYFLEAGGMFFTRASYSRYAELQNALESLHGTPAADAVSDGDYESVRRLCSALRHQMAGDLGTRG